MQQNHFFYVLNQTELKLNYQIESDRELGKLFRP